MIANDILLLKLIDANANLTLLRQKGLSHSQISALLQTQIDLGYITISESHTSLTASGKEKLKIEFEFLNLMDKDSWILPQEVYYNKPISQKVIFLPKKI